MGNRAKKTKRNLVRSLKPAATAAAPAATKAAPAQPAQQAPARPPGVAPGSTAVSESSQRAPRIGLGPHDARLRQHLVATSTKHYKCINTQDLPARQRGQSVPDYLDSLPVQKKQEVLDSYWATRRIFPMPEITVSFPDDAQTSETALKDYHESIERQKTWYSEQCAMQERNLWGRLHELGSAAWVWLRDPVRHHRAECAQIYYNNSTKYENLRAVSTRREFQRQTRERAEALAHIGDQFLDRMYIGENAQCLGRRFPWRNNRAQGSIFYNFLRSLADPVVLSSPQLATERVNMPTAFRIANHIALETARYHRMYSEAMGLWHSPWRPDLRSQVDFDPPLAEAQAFQQRMRTALLAPNLRILAALRAANPIYHPGQSGDFHNGRQPEWLEGVNGALNTFKALPVHEQIGLKERILFGEDSSSWYAFDARELGPMMKALRGFHDPDDNVGTGDDIRIFAFTKQFNANESLADRKGRTGAEPDPEGELYRHCATYRSDTGSGSVVTVVGNCAELNYSGFVIDEQRALQGVGAHLEMLKLARRLREAAHIDAKRRQRLLSSGDGGYQGPWLHRHKKTRAMAPFPRLDIAAMGVPVGRVLKVALDGTAA